MEQGEISFDLFWAAGRYFTGDNAQENVAEMWLKSQLCTIKGRLWQPCGTHTHGFGMVMSSEVWNTCLPRLPIGTWGEHESELLYYYIYASLS